MTHSRSLWVRLLAAFLLIAMVGSLSMPTLAQSDEGVVSDATPGVDDGSTDADPEITSEPSRELTVETDVTSEAAETVVAEASPEVTPDTRGPPEVTAEPTVEAGEGDVNASDVNFITINVVDGAGNPVVGTCFEFSATLNPFVAIVIECDDGDGQDDGTVTVPLDGVIASSLWARQSTESPGFADCNFQCFLAVLPTDLGETFTVVNRRLASLVITKVDQDGNTLPGACFWDPLQEGQVEVCDDDDGANDGTITLGPEWRKLSDGDNFYSIPESQPPVGYLRSPNSVVFIGDEDATVTIVNVLESLAGSIRVDKVDEEGNPLLGACFYPVGVENGLTYDNWCDYNDDLVNFLDDGSTYFPDLPPGEYDLYEYQEPDGYGRSYAPVRVTVETGEETVVEFVNYLPVSLTIRKVNTAGDLLPGAYFYIYPSGSDDIIDSFEDGEDGANDGLIQTLEVDDGVGPGVYRIEEIDPPPGYVAPEESFEVTLRSGDNLITVVNRKIVNLTVEKRDENGDPLPGSCFALAPYDNPNEGVEVCDDDDGSDDGFIEFEDQIEGDYYLFESQSPEGYAAAFPLSLALGLEDRLEIVVNTPLSEAATVIIEKVDENGDPLGGACFELFEGKLDPQGDPLGTAAQEACDADDGNDDGVITFEPVPLSNGEGNSFVSIVESIVPEGYEGAAPLEVELLIGDTTVEVENLPTDDPGPTLTPETSPTAGPTHTAVVEEDDEDDVTMLPQTGAGFAGLGAGGFFSLLMVAVFAIGVGALGFSSRRSRNAKGIS